MKIYEFTQPELDVFREKCNFTPDELQCFELKAQHRSIVQISFIMHISEAQVSKLTRRIKNKIIRVL